MEGCCCARDENKNIYLIGERFYVFNGGSSPPLTERSGEGYVPRIDSCVVICNGILHVFGGRSPTTFEPVKDMVYNTETKMWGDMHSEWTKSWEAFGSAAVVWPDDSHGIVVLGGWDVPGIPCFSCRKYDVDHQNWVELAKMPTSRTGFAVFKKETPVVQ